MSGPASHGAAIACGACGSEALEPFYEAPAIPVHSCLLLASREEARSYPCRDLRLACCHDCGFIQNDRFDASVHEYSARYEETQSYSPRFRRFLEELAEGVIERHDLRGKHIVEIGCGKGEFITALCALGPNRGTGFDPSYRPERNPHPAARAITFVRELFDERHVGTLEAELWCCRHTLEHIAPVEAFVRRVRRAMGEHVDAVALFEVPDVEHLLREVAFWDVYYEHCAYFSAGSLRRLFERAGFEVLDLWRAYDGQYLLLEARPARPIERAVERLRESGAEGRVDGNAHDHEHEHDDRPRMRALAARFAEEAPRSVERWRGVVAGAAAAGRPAALWGAGSKAVAFLAALGEGAQVGPVVDVNPHKEGFWLPPFGHRIDAPAALCDASPSLVILMNPIYRDEVTTHLARHSVEAPLVALGDPLA